MQGDVWQHWQDKLPKVITCGDQPRSMFGARHCSPRFFKPLLYGTVELWPSWTVSHDRVFDSCSMKSVNILLKFVALQEHQFCSTKWFGLKFSPLNAILWTSNPLATWCEGPIRQHTFVPCKHTVKIQTFGRKHCIQILHEIVLACSLSHTQACAKDLSKGPAGSPGVQSPPSKARKPQGDPSCHEAMGVCVMEQQVLLILSLPITNIHRALWHKRGSCSSPCLRGSVRYRNRHLPSCRSPFRPLHFWLPGAKRNISE